MSLTSRLLLLLAASLIAIACESFYAIERSAYVCVGPLPCKMVAEKGWSGVFVRKCEAETTPTSMATQAQPPSSFLRRSGEVDGLVHGRPCIASPTQSHDGAVRLACRR